MFERFSTEAREVVLRARDDAIQLRHRQIGTEHLLLALTENEGITGRILHAAGLSADSVRERIQRLVPSEPGLLTDEDAAALRSVGIDLDAVMARIEQSFGPDALLQPAGGRRGWFSRRRQGTGRFGPRAKKVLELSLRESWRLKDNNIGSGHLLLGLLREGEGLAAKIIREAGADFAVLREQTEQALRRAA